MNLSYIIDDNGYTILNHGKAWIKQDVHIPYPGSTMEESAQNHIDQIIAESNAPEPVDELTDLKNQVADLWEMVLFGGAIE